MVREDYFSLAFSSCDPVQVLGLLNAPKISMAYIFDTNMIILDLFALIQRKLPNLAFPGINFDLFI